MMMGAPKQAQLQRRGQLRSFTSNVRTFQGIFFLIVIIIVVEFLLMHLHVIKNPDYMQHSPGLMERTSMTRPSTSKPDQVLPQEQYMDVGLADSGDTDRDNEIQALAPKSIPDFRLPFEAHSGISGSRSSDEGYGDMRIAVLIPYSGSGLPSWFDAFAELAGANAALMDWLIFCEEELAQVRTPQNVKMISTTPTKLAWLLARVVYPSYADDSPEIYVSDLEYYSGNKKPTALQDKPFQKRSIATHFISRLLDKNPYYMVEFKPALGWVFREYLEGYTHWAYGDLDVFMGDFTKGWLEPYEMREYDIVTYSFGDQNRAYLRGQLTIQKMSDKVDKLWRRCWHLSNFVERVQQTRKSKKYHLESAEGCYSAVLMSTKDVKVKYAVKVFTDMPGSGFEENEFDVVITGDALVKRCDAIPQRIGEDGGPVALLGSMQEDVGDLLPVEIAPPGTSCEYWVHENFQTCLELKKPWASRNIYLIDGKFYERAYQNRWVDVVEKGCSMGAFHHFQDFKGNYRVWNTRPPISPIHKGMIAGKGGLIPLPSGDWKAMALDSNLSTPEGRDRFTHRYCMRWRVGVAKKKNKTTHSCSVSVTAKDALRTVYNSTDKTGSYDRDHGKKVTLGAVGVMRDLEKMLLAIRDWAGPKILVLLLSSDDFSAAQGAVAEEALAGGSPLKETLVVAFLVPSENKWESDRKHVFEREFPAKTLLNALHDHCKTRYLLTLAPGFRIGDGSEEAVYAALARSSDQPRVLVISQWCLLRSATRLQSMTLEDIRERRRGGTANLCHLEGSNNAREWLGSSAVEGVERFRGDRREGGRLRGAELDSKLTNVGNTVSLLQSDVATPILVVDLWSAPALFLRHVEEFTRRRCFDGAYARGLLASGFVFELVPDAFAFAAGPIPRPDKCVLGVDEPASEYAMFLKDIRRVYGDSSTIGALHGDSFRVAKGVSKHSLKRKGRDMKQFKTLADRSSLIKASEPRAGAVREQLDFRKKA